jgi:hypothetical protein
MTAVLKEWGITEPEEEDYLKAAREVFQVRGLSPRTPADDLINVLSQFSQS